MTQIELNVAQEIFMLDCLITGLKLDIEMLIDADAEWEVINDARIDLACYQADRAAYN